MKSVALQVLALSCLLGLSPRGAEPALAQTPTTPMTMPPGGPIPFMPYQPLGEAFDLNPFYQTTLEVIREKTAGGVIVSTLTGGRYGMLNPACGHGTNAFVARYDAGDHELWRRVIGDSADVCEGGCDLLQGFNGLDRNYIVGGQVHYLALDPQTGNVIAVGNLVLAWYSGHCAAGPTVMRGGFGVELTAQGVPLQHVYTGPQPQGLPWKTSQCSFSCQTQGSEPLTSAPTAAKTQPLEAGTTCTLEDAAGGQSPAPGPDVAAPEPADRLARWQTGGRQPSLEEIVVIITGGPPMGYELARVEELEVVRGHLVQGGVEDLDASDDVYAVFSSENDQGDEIIEVSFAIALEAGSLCIETGVSDVSSMSITMQPSGFEEPIPFAHATLYPGTVDNVAIFPMELLLDELPAGATVAEGQCAVVHVKLVKTATGILYASYDELKIEIKP